ncbi:hypothetical protein FRC10_001917, partial [Ceratobasidium sp. 414]
MRAVSWILAAVLTAPALASNVLEVTSKNFDSIIGQGKPALVELYVSLSSLKLMLLGGKSHDASRYILLSMIAAGTARTLRQSTSTQLADAFSHAKDKVLIIKADADGEAKEVAGKHGVTGFPTLKWFGADDAVKSEPYDGGRDLETLAAFIEKNAGVKSNIKPPPPPETLQLTYRDFDDVVMNPENDVIVAFTAPWCGHCKSLKPILEKVAKTFKPESKCIVAQMDADAEVNREVAGRYNVRSYPTIKFFPKGSDKSDVPYEIGRSEADFVKFLNEHCGTHRAVGGGLNDLAGRLPTLDSLAQRYYTADKAARELIHTEAKAAGDNASYYVRVMEKLAASAEDWVTKESKRLNGILAKRTMA